jgi:uncharacterized membrane protein YqjE
MAEATRSRRSERTDDLPPPDDRFRGSEPGGPSIAGLLQEIVGNVQGIIRSEVRLAKTEVKEDVSAMVRAAALLVAGAVLGMYALGIILLFVVYLLRGPLPDWAAALIVGLVVAAVASVLVALGLNRIKSVNPAPDQTISSIKEDVQWVRHQAR